MNTPIDWRHLSNETFAALGAGDLVYIRPFRGEAGAVLYSIRAANGDELAIIDSMENAVMTARLNNFEPMSLH